MNKGLAQKEQDIRVLLIEKDADDFFLIREMLGGREASTRDPHQFELARADRLSTALERLSGEDFAVVLLDPSLPAAQGLDTLVRAHEKAPEGAINKSSNRIERRRMPPK